MNLVSIRRLSATLLLGALVTFAWRADAGRELVRFPETFADGIRYAIVPRGAIRQELYTSQAAIDAAKSGRPLPSGTVITLVDYRDGKLFRYVVMEKRTGWGGEYPPEQRNGEWEFQAFNADRSVNQNENIGRCFSCHKSQERQDFVFTLDRMKSTR
jgi:hypothetical protein